MARKKSYKQQLNERKKQLKDAIAKAEKELSGRQMDVQWFDQYGNINHLRADLAIVKSRLEHIGKRNKHNCIKTAHIDINHLNKLNLL